MANQRRDAEKEVFWREVVQRHAASGVSVRWFCQHEQLVESAFYAWRRTIAERDGQVLSGKLKRTPARRLRPAPAAFVPAVVTNLPAREASIVLELAGWPRAATAGVGLDGSVGGTAPSPRSGRPGMIGADLQGVQVWVATTPVDMRKSFDSLAEVVRSFLARDPLSGHLFVFRNRGGQLVKVLWWDRDGLAIYYKRLTRGAFQFPQANTPAIEISCAELLQLLSGMKLSSRQPSGCSRTAD